MNEAIQTAKSIACTILGHDWYWYAPVNGTDAYEATKHFLITIDKARHKCERCGVIRRASDLPHKAKWWQVVFPNGLLRLCIGINLIASAIQLITIFWRFL